MARPKKESPDKKDERDIDLFNEYEKVLKSEGEKAPYIVKSYFYEQVAKKFYLSTGTTKNIIRKMLRKKTNSQVIDVRK